LRRRIEALAAREDALEDGGDFKDRAVGHRRRIPPVFLQFPRSEHFIRGRRDLTKISDHQTDLLFANPIRVVALLRQRPRIANGL